MKIQLDTDKKTIKIESDVKISELINTLEYLLPKGAWKEFTLETHTTINNWSNPLVIRDRTYPWYSPYTVACSTDAISIGKNYLKASSSGSMEIKPGIYNIEC